jgi:hypothetical protein
MHRKLAIAAIALFAPALPLAVTAAPADAHDTSWGCPGCVSHHR